MKGLFIMKKKIAICLLLSVVFILGIAFATNAANNISEPEKAIVDHIVYEYDNNYSAYYIKGFDGSDESKNITTIVTQNEINSIPVRGFVRDAFQNNVNIKSVVLSENIKHIAIRTFNNCKNLSSITIKGELETVGEYAFENCTSLKSIKFTGALKLIDRGAFKNSGLTSVTIPGSADAKEAAFRNCKNLQKVVFSNEGCTGEKFIFSPLKFNGCTKLKKIYFYRQVDDIGIYSDCFNQGTTNDAFDLSDIYFFGSEKLWNTLITSKEAKRFGDVDMHYYYKHTHSFAKASKKATCAKAGKDVYSCVCGDSFSYKTEKDKNNHSFGEWKTTKKATKTKDGTQEHICKLCSKKETRKLIHVAKLKISSKDVVYTGAQEYNRKIVVKNGKTKLKNGTHYTLTYKNNTGIGTATVTVKGVEKNGYYGSAKLTFDIIPDSLESPVNQKILEDMQILTWESIEDAKFYKIFAIIPSDEAPGGYYSTQIASSETATAEVPARYEKLQINAYSESSDLAKPIVSDIPYQVTEIKKQDNVLFCSWNPVPGATGYKIYERITEGKNETWTEYYVEVADVKTTCAQLPPDSKNLYIKAYTNVNGKIYLSQYYTYI